jgi:hypothetical protein
MRDEKMEKKEFPSSPLLLPAALNWEMSKDIWFSWF